jgi:dissimilatory sulfite reductase (desulfoviridin) alpha/beta subunit
MHNMSDFGISGKMRFVRDSQNRKNNCETITPSILRKRMECATNGHQWKMIKNTIAGPDTKWCGHCKTTWKTHSYRPPRFDRKGHVVQ